MIPSKVMIGAMEYVIQEDHIRGDDLFGDISYAKNIIRIDATLAEERKEQVLAHEILHGLFYEAGFTEQDEDMINRLGPFFHQFIQSNLLFLPDKL